MDEKRFASFIAERRMVFHSGQYTDTVSVRMLYLCLDYGANCFVNWNKAKVIVYSNAKLKTTTNKYATLIHETGHALSMAHCFHYDYDELTTSAKIITKVEVLDNLSNDNSTLYYDKYDTDPDSIVGYCSKRKVRVVEVYKGAEYVKAGDSLKIIESTAISGNSYFHSEGYTAMVKGNTYLVYLNDDTASHEMSIMSCSNGRVNLTDPQEDTDHLDVVVKSLAEFESDLPKSEKEKILNSQEIQYLPNTKNEDTTLRVTGLLTSCAAAPCFYL